MLDSRKTAPNRTPGLKNHAPNAEVIPSDFPESRTHPRVIERRLPLSLAAAGILAIGTTVGAVPGFGQETATTTTQTAPDEGTATGAPPTVSAEPPPPAPAPEPEASTPDPAPSAPSPPPERKRPAKQRNATPNGGNAKKKRSAKGAARAKARAKAKDAVGPGCEPKAKVAPPADEADPTAKDGAANAGGATENPAADGAKDAGAAAQAPAATTGADDTPDDEPCAPADSGDGTTGKDRSSKKDGDPRQAKPSEPATPSGAATTDADGKPSTANPSVTLADPGPARVGVPNFVIDKFRIPPFLLPIYKAAEAEYNIPWQVLAAVNEIETDYGRNLNVSSAGALGWMQFMPATWKAYGTDANGDSKRDPYNPVDAIFSAARYIKAAGGDKNIREGLFAYNRADWYVESVLLRAKVIGGMPSDLVGGLTELTQGRFPVAAKARYADSRPRTGSTRSSASGGAQSIDVFAEAGAPVVAVNDGIVRKVGNSRRLGRYLVLEDWSGNRYVYSQLGSVMSTYPVPKEDRESNAPVDDEMGTGAPKDPVPTAAASAGSQRPADRGNGGGGKAPRGAPRPLPIATMPPLQARPTTDSLAPLQKRPTFARRSAPDAPATAGAPLQGRPTFAADAAPITPANAAAPVQGRPPPSVAKERLYANPTRPSAYSNGGREQIVATGASGEQDFSSYGAEFATVYGLDRDKVELKSLREGSQVLAGTVLGRIGVAPPGKATSMSFAIRPAGKGAPRIDPKPILDGWKLLESTAIYRAKGDNPFVGPGAKTPSLGQMLLMTKGQLGRHVLEDTRIDIYQCGRDDIRAGLIDKRVLVTLKWLAGAGLRPTVSSLKCGHSKFVAGGGRISDHWFGRAVDLAAVNGISILDNQQDGGITDITIRKLLELKGIMSPTQIISLRTYAGADNTLALPDHDDHIHIGFGAPSGSGQPSDYAALKPSQWPRLIGRLGEIVNPKVPTRPSRDALPAQRGRRARGD